MLPLSMRLSRGCPDPSPKYVKEADFIKVKHRK
jgi:hypothetical protein